MKGYVVGIIALAAALMVGVLYLNVVVLTSKVDKSFNEVYQKLSELTFKVGENSTLAQHFRAVGYYPNGTKKVYTDSVREFVIRNFTWPYYQVCFVERGQVTKDCAQVFFPYIALPVEVLGTRNIVLPFGGRGAPIELTYDGLDSVSSGGNIYTVYKYRYEVENYAQSGKASLYLMYDVETGALVKAQTRSSSPDMNITMDMWLEKMDLGEEHVMVKPARWPWSVQPSG